MSKSYRSASHRWLPYRQSSLKHFAGLAVRALAVCAMLIAFGTVARSQTATGQFNGHVYDQNGAVLPGATVTLTDLQTNLVRTKQTNGEGLYEFPLIPPGLYKIAVTANRLRHRIEPRIAVGSKPGRYARLQADSRFGDADSYCYVFYRVAPGFHR